MTPNDYQQAALRTAPKDLPPDRLLLNGLMGLNTVCIAIRMIFKEGFL